MIPIITSPLNTPERTGSCERLTKGLRTIAGQPLEEESSFPKLAARTRSKVAYLWIITRTVKHCCIMCDVMAVYLGGISL